MTLHPLYGLGDFGTNCYILASSDGLAALIDAPYSAAAISKKLDSEGLRLKKIFLTHGHCDHIEALGGLCEKYGCEVFISPGDAKMLADGRLCLSEYFGTPFKPFYGAKELSDGETLSLGDISLKVMFTPGHSAGSVCYIARDFIFTGDTLFEGSVGRTDLGGDMNVLLSSVKKLMDLGRNYTVYPGHGAPSDLETEFKFNPWLGPLRN